MESDAEGRNDDAAVKAWRLEDLRQLGFNFDQRQALLECIEKGEIELAEIRDLIQKRHWTPEQVFLCAA